jgi:Major tropism determinant N-terminal domain
MTTIRVRRGTASQWSTANPTLALGELGLETDTSKLKGGDGVTVWNSLGYISAGGGGGGGNSWGSITGTLSSQTDLQNALNAKASLTEATFSGAISATNLSGTNTGDQTNITGNAGTVTTINGRISAGTNVSITGSGTAASPYVINSSGGGAGSSVDTYIQDTAPSVGAGIPYLWINTTGGNLQFMIEDGI